MTDTRSAGLADGRQDTGRDGLPSVTIAYIAESAGVSVPTVSKVLNRRSGVSDRTRARVEETIARYGYRKPQGSRSNLVELVFHELRHMWGAEILQGVEKAARKNRVGVVVSEFGPDDTAAVAIDDTVGRRPRCVLSVAHLRDADREQLRAEGIPFVVFDPIGELPDGVPFVSATNWRGGQSAVHHLLGLGHRRIAMISGPDHAFCIARVSGYTSALQEAGLPADPGLLVRTQFTPEHGYAAARELLSRRDRPTAVFAAGDVQAVGVYQAARELGLSIPRDLSVVGFDDLPIAAWTDPPLTTVRQPITAMAAAATELALALGGSRQVSRTRLDIGTTLIPRASTAPPRT